MAFNIYSSGIHTDFHLISHHPKPFANTGNLWDPFDLETWLLYALGICALLFSVLLIRGIHDKSHSVDLSDVMTRMTLGMFEQHRVTWYENVASAQAVILLFSILGLTFNIFYNIEFRFFLITQKFPEPINDIIQVDLMKSGFFADYSSKSILEYTVFHLV